MLRKLRELLVERLYLLSVIQEQLLVYPLFLALSLHLEEPSLTLCHTNSIQSNRFLLHFLYLVLLGIHAMLLRLTLRGRAASLFVVMSVFLLIMLLVLLLLVML